MLWPEGFKEPTTGYACPFPSSPALAPPPGMVLEVYLQAGQDGLPQEAMAQFCDRSARALLKACGGDDLLVQFEPGPAEVRWAAPPPGEALWWIVPDRILLPGGSEMGGGDSCLVEALAGWEIASPFHERVMRVRLVEDDLQTGCAREVDEKCQ